VTQAKSGWFDFVSREVWAIAVAVSVLGIAILPRNAAALTALLVAALWPLLVAVLRWRDVSLPPRRSLLAVGIAAIPVVFIAIRSALAYDPRVSLIGTVGQHAGSLLWLTALCALGAAALTVRPGDLGRMSRAFGVTGAVLAVAGVLDRLGAFASIRYSTEPSGFMENSVSLGQVLVVAAGCAAAWALGSRSMVQRTVAWITFGTVLGGLLIADSLGAWVGLGVGVVVALAAYGLARAGKLGPALVASVLVAVLALSTVWLVVMLSNGVQPGFEKTLADASNNRFRIWTSAVAQFRAMPVIGEGAEQFSAWVTWDVDPGPALRKTGTYDPHNLGLWWLLAGGIAGTLAAIAGAWALTERSLALLAARPAPPVAALFAGVAAWTVSALFAWVSPLALMMAAVVSGALVALAPDPQKSPAPAAEEAGDAEATAEPAGEAVTPAPGRGRILVGVLASIGVVVVVGLFVAGASYEYVWARSVDLGQPDGGALVLAAVETGDPSLASIAVDALFARVRTGGEGPQEVRILTKSIEPVLRRAAVWHVDAAFSLFSLETVDLGVKTDTDFGDVAAVLDSARKADPTTGFWDTIGALQAESMGFTEAAKVLREAALSHPLPPGAQSIIMEQSAQ